MNKKERSLLLTDQLYKTQKEYFGEEYKKAEAAPWDKAFDARKLQKIVRQFAPANGRWALDIGAGHGRGSMTLDKAGWRTVGLDYLFDPLSTASKAYANGPHFIQGDAFEAPFQDHCFSLILDWGLFHHVRRRDESLYLDAISRLLAPSGGMILGCFSSRFRHKGDSGSQNWKRHKGHYDRLSTQKELYKTFGSIFTIESIEENPAGFYLLALVKR